MSLEFRRMAMSGDTDVAAISIQAALFQIALLG